MKILFSPSEGKKSGGDATLFSQKSFLFPKLYNKRLEAVSAYNDFVASASDEALTKLFGIKDTKQFATYKTNIHTAPTMKAIKRYDGVAFDYLDYDALDARSQSYIDANTIIFSNLFGPILAGDCCLPEYKLKQGEKIGSFAPELFYKKHFTSELDVLLAPEPFLDLRAGFYNKFYKPTTPYTTLKFIKEGKVVSHWAKAYRGVVLRLLAMNTIKTIDELMNMPIEGVCIKEVLTKGIHTEIIYEINN